MKKADSEKLVRTVVRDRAARIGFDRKRGDHPSFTDFKAWLLASKPDALDFRSQCGAEFDAGQWFDEEPGQTWRR